MLTQDERITLRDLSRDAELHETEQSLLKKVIRYIGALESKLHAVRTFAKAIDKEARFKDEEQGQ